MTGRLDLMAITNDPDAARAWVAGGVDLVMIDFETFGKAERQAGRDTVQSRHTLDELSALVAAVGSQRVVARIEPIEAPNWSEHVEAVLRRHPGSVMLPMARTPGELARFVDAVNGRARLIPMIETLALLENLAGMVNDHAGLRWFVGLNDLHLELGHSSIFEPLALGYVDRVASLVDDFGFGGIAQIDSGEIDASLVLHEHVRLGSSLVILARSFFAALDDPADERQVREAIEQLRAAEAASRRRDALDRERDRDALIAAVTGLRQ